MNEIKADDYLEILNAKKIDILEDEKELKKFREKYNTINKFTADDKEKEIKGFTDEELFKMVYYAEYNTYEQMSRLFDTTTEVIENLFNYCEFYKLEEEPTIVEIKEKIKYGKEQMLSNYFSFKKMQKHFNMTYKEIASIENKLFDFNELLSKEEEMTSKEILSTLEESEDAVKSA